MTQTFGRVRAVIQARMTSERLRGKSLMPLAGKPLLARVVERVRGMPFVDEVVVATSSDDTDDPIAAFVERLGVPCYRGSGTDVLGRFLGATTDMSEDDCLARFTADNPLYDVGASTSAWEYHVRGECDYTHVDGLSPHVPEFVRVGALRASAALARAQWDREHVTPALRRHRDLFRVQALPPGAHGLRPEFNGHFTVDRREQLNVLEKMIVDLERRGAPPSLAECYGWLDEAHAAPHVVPSCYLVAEIGVNHYDIARKRGIDVVDAATLMIREAARAGADAVKFQAYRAETLASRESPAYWDTSEEATLSQYELFKKYDGMPYSAFGLLADVARDCGVDFMCTPFDEQAVDAIDPLVNVHKVASADLTNVPLLRKIARTGKRIHLSTGAAVLPEIARALEMIRGEGKGNDVVLFHCVLCYPVKPEDANLLGIATLAEHFPACEVGYSDHLLPTPGMQALVLACVLGARVVEKHFTLDKTLLGNDHYHAMDPEDVLSFRRSLADARVWMGDGDRSSVAADGMARLHARRSLVARRDIQAGETFSESNLITKRPGTGIGAGCWDDVVGKSALGDVKADALLSWDVVEVA